MATSSNRRGTKELHAGSEYLGADIEVGLKDIHYGDTEQIATDVGMDTVSMEAFMNETLLIMVQSSGAENETPLVYVAVNGQSMLLPRDEPIRVKRKYVEVLARAKKTEFDQVLDMRMGEEMNRLIAKNSLKYPFTVISDPNPRGVQWVQEVLAQRR